MSWTIRKKLLTGFAAVLILTLVLGVFAVMRLGTINDGSAEIGENWLPATLWAGNASTAAANMRVRELRYLLVDTPEEREKAAHAYERDEATFVENMKLFEATIAKPEERKAYDEMMVTFREYAGMHDRIVEMVKQGKTQEAEALGTFGDSFSLYTKLDEQTNDLMKIEEKFGREVVEANKSAYASARMWLFGALLATLALGVGIALWLANMISRPVAAISAAVSDLASEKLPQLSSVAKAIAAGDLTRDAEVRIETLPVTTKDEVGQMTSAFNQMAGGINEMGESFRQMSSNLRDSMGQIGQGSNQVA